LHISGRDAYSVKNNVQNIQQEIMTNGPVEGAFTVYEDFIHYKSGMEENCTMGSFMMYSVSSIIRVIKSRRMRWIQHVVCMG
jgi:hypothetical protein